MTASQDGLGLAGLVCIGWVAILSHRITVMQFPIEASSTLVFVG